MTDKLELAEYVFYYEDIGENEIQVETVHAYSIIDAESRFSSVHPTAGWYEIELPEREYLP